MSKSLQENKHFILFFLETPSSCQQKAVLKQITKSQYQALSQISLNLISGHIITLTKQNIDKLKKYKSFLERLASNKPINKKRLATKHKAVHVMLSVFSPHLKEILQ